MKRIIIAAFAIAITASFCACGPTPEEIAQTEWMLETIEEQERLEKQLEDTLDESEQLMDGLNQDIEQILGMSLDEAMGEEEAIEEETVEPTAETVEEEPIYQGSIWSVKIGDFDATSDGLAKELIISSIKIEDTEYEGYHIGDVLDIAKVGSISEVRILFEDGSMASIGITELFENDTMLIIKTDSEYLEKPALYFSDTYYEKVVIEIVVL